MGHNGRVLMGDKKMQRIAVGVVIGVIVLSLALSLVGSAMAAPPDTSRAPAQALLAVPATGETPTPDPSLVESNGPKPVTKTPQGTSTQVTHREHIGGLIAFVAFMSGGVLLLLRAKRRERREQEQESILSAP